MNVLHGKSAGCNNFGSIRETSLESTLFALSYGQTGKATVRLCEDPFSLCDNAGHKQFAKSWVKLYEHA